MSEVASAFVTVMPSMKGFGSTVLRESSKAGDTSGRRFGGVFAKATIGPLRTFGGLAAGIFAVDKVKDFFGSAIAEARESQKVSALTAQVIKSTGGAAQISAKQVGELSTAISNKVGIDDEAIQSGENLLLTFKNIRNETGAGNDIFNQTTQVMTDMSAALGQDMKSSALQLGKALNDPIKGVTALQRVGVSFTQSQRDQIASLVESGHTMQAQKLILGELNSEFGGAAAASTTMGEKVGVAWSNIKEQAGTALLPVIDTIERGLITGLFPALQKIGSGFGTYVVPALKQFGAFVKTDVVPAVQEITQQIGPPLLNVVRTTFGYFQTDVLPVLQGIGAFIIDKLAPAIGQILSAALQGLQGLIQKVSGVIQEHRDQFEALLQAVKAVATIIVKVAVPAIKIALKVAFKILGVEITTFIKVVAGVISIFQKVVAGGQAVGHFFTGPFAGAFTSVGRKVRDTFTGIVHFISGMPGKIARAAAGMWDGIKNAFRSAINFIIHGWNSLQFTLPKVNTHIPGVGTIGGWTLGTPDIPYLKHGGIVTSPRLVVAGDGGESEAVLPLSQLDRMLTSRSGGAADDARLAETNRRLASIEKLLGGLGADISGNLNSVAAVSMRHARNRRPVAA